VGAAGEEVLVLRVSALACAVLALAACGGAGDDASEDVQPDAVIAQAADATVDAGSYRMAMVTDMTMEGAGDGPLTMSAEGEFDPDERLGHMTMDMSELAQGQAAGPLEAEVIFDGLVFYMKMPFLQQTQPGLKEWIRFDLQALGEEAGLDLDQLMQLGSQSDPSQTLAYLRAASDDIQEVGSEEVRGVETTHYRMTVDLSRVAETAPSDQREALQAQIDELIEKSGIQEVPTEVWIDEDGLVRRQRVTYENMAFAPGAHGDMTITMELFDFGVDVEVEPPPAGQVVDLQELLEGGQQ
jgi:hypothetical protein